MTQEPTVFVVDDDEAVRIGLRYLLESEGLAVRCFTLAQDFLDAYDPNDPGCLLLDIRMPGMSGMELQEHLVAQGIIIPVIIITGHGDIPMAVKAVQNGALDFIEKPFRGQTLLERIRTALELDRQHREKQGRKVVIEERLASLTRRERQVMGYVVDGKTNKAIAEELGVTIKAIEAHRARMMRKMQAGSLAELVRMVPHPKPQQPLSEE